MADEKAYESTKDTAPLEEPPTYSESAVGQPELPSYQDVERSGPPPPSYESIFGRARAIKAESSGNVDFIKRLTLIFVGTIGFTIFLGVILAIPIAMIVMGSKYLHQCPAERYIPIYLIVAGAFGVLRNSITIVRRCCKREGEDEEERRKINPVESILDCFIFAWFIAGNVWIYRTNGHFSEDPNASNFCDPTLYWFAFWITTAVYIVIACSCCCCCFCGMFAVCLDSGKK